MLTLELDIVPDLLDKIKKDFNKEMNGSEKLKKILKKIDNGDISYSVVNDYAVELGELLAKVFGKNITLDVLPDGRMYYNIAERILNETLSNNHYLVSSMAAEIQTELNKQAGMGIKGIQPTLKQDRIDGLINRISSEELFEEIQWILNEPIVIFSQSIVDDAIKENAEFHVKSGLYPTVTRTAVGRACDWCKSIAGVYKYPNVPDDVYKRHSNCRCTVEYNPTDSKRVNVWTKERR